MGCLNSNNGFQHWFGNIHLSGPCNRKCYFCIGQYMMALDSQNNLSRWPLDGLDDFIEQCKAKGVREVNVTGTNTDPLLFQHNEKLVEVLRHELPGVVLGIRTNGALATQMPEVWRLYDKGSITLPSFKQDVYTTQMGIGIVPDIAAIMKMDGPNPIKINIVLGEENRLDVFDTLEILHRMGIKKVNLREPYGQPYVGNPMEEMESVGTIFGMPQYDWLGMSVVYWDVHYVQVESVNLYAQGRVSITYPITKGHDLETGAVFEQSHWNERGRHNEQWVLGVNGSTADS